MTQKVLIAIYTAEDTVTLEWNKFQLIDDKNAYS